MIFVFSSWFPSLSMRVSTSIHVTANGIILFSLFSWWQEPFNIETIAVVKIDTTIHSGNSNVKYNFLGFFFFFFFTNLMVELQANVPDFFNWAGHPWYLYLVLTQQNPDVAIIQFHQLVDKSLLMCSVATSIVALAVYTLKHRKVNSRGMGIERSKF